MKLASLILISLMVSGCAGTGFNKTATLMPDEVWLYNEAGPFSDTHKTNQWQEIKLGGAVKWQLKDRTDKKTETSSTGKPLSVPR